MAFASHTQWLATKSMHEGGCPDRECARDIYNLCRRATDAGVPDMTPEAYRVWLKGADVFDGYVSALTMWRKACGADVSVVEVNAAIYGLGHCDDSISNPGVAKALINMGLVEEAKAYLDQYNNSPSVENPYVVQLVITSYQEPPATTGKAGRTGGAATKRTHRSSGPI